MTPPETFALRPEGSEADSPGWSVRVVPNKFPALTGQADGAAIHAGARAGVGIHEVIIESPFHDRSFPDHPLDHAGRLLGVLRDRYHSCAQSPTSRYVCIFNNHGRRSGASLPHPHFQLLAPSVVPAGLAHRMAYYQDYYDQHKRSVFDMVVAEELAAGERVIAANEHFVAFCPFGSRCPYEAYIVPRQDCPDFASTTDDVLGSLAELLQPPLVRLKQDFGDPDYNLAVHTAPLDCDGAGVLRWYLEIYPRLATRGGFEISTHMYINTVSPETAAAFYRGESESGRDC